MLLTYTLISFFQFFFPDSRPIILYYVTSVMCLFIIQEIKETENKRKRKIKSKKIDNKIK